MNKSDNIRLKLWGLPEIQTVDDFSEIIHISKYTIFQLSNHANKYYKTYEIPKKNGKLRVIRQPSKKLKGLQSWILNNILDKLKVSNSCKGFQKGSSTADNAEPHKLSSAILTIDLKDFFTNIKRNQVYSIFKSIGYNPTISTILTNLCCYEDTLPQGSPCSPRLANLATWTLDVRIQGYVGRRGLNYTRYADDLTFSGPNPIKLIKIYPVIKLIIENEKFKINHDKTRMAGLGRAKKVTGLIISNDSFGVGMSKYKEIRAKIHHLTLPNEQSNLSLLSQVQGWLSYLNSVDEKKLKIAVTFIEKLKNKHPTTLISKLAF